MTEEYLKNAIKAGRFGHAYIIAGDGVTARRQTAERIAALLLCEQGTGCGECHACRQMKAGSHPDLVRVTNEKAQTISVDEVRTQVCDVAEIRPFQSARKVIIMDDAQLMNDHGQNALLKTIEEPPEYLVILLLVDNEKKMLETIRSRCVILRLGENAERYDDDGDDALKQVLFARNLYHDVMVYKRTKSETALILPDRLHQIREMAGALSYEEIEKSIDAIDTAEKRLSMSVNPEITMSLLRDAVSIG